jgi:3-phenylpropionate/trans-cinnamate dioxygenase ferredoxin reductase subunit
VRSLSSVDQRYDVLIVGGGVAAASLIGSLGSKAFTGSIGVLSAEDTPFYDRPPLSKGYLAGTVDLQGLSLPVLDSATVHGGVEAVGLDMDQRIVTADSGAAFGFGELVVATGVAARRLQPKVDPHQLAQVFRTVTDASRLRDGVQPGKEYLIVGAGVLGLELSATLTTLGASVTVVEPSTAPLANAVGTGCAELIVSRHRSHGVRFILGSAVSLLERDGARIRAHLGDGADVMVDEVIACIGSTPNTDWLDGSGLHVDDGVVVDMSLCASQHVFAIGDVARLQGVGGRRGRYEHRAMCNGHAEVVADRLGGQPAEFREVPFFWTDQYDLKVQAAGLLDGTSCDAVVSEDGRRGVWSIYDAGETLSGIVCMNAPRDFVRARRSLQNTWTWAGQVT